MHHARDAAFDRKRGTDREKNGGVCGRNRSIITRHIVIREPIGYYLNISNHQTADLQLLRYHSEILIDMPAGYNIIAVNAARYTNTGAYTILKSRGVISLTAKKRLQEAAMKQRIYVLMLIVALLFASGCQSGGTPASDGSLPAGNGTAASAEPVPETELREPKKNDYRIAANPDVVTRGCSTDTGFFQVLPREEGGSNLMFIDYASAQQTFVCSSPACAHNDEACPSYIKEDFGYAVFPAVYENSLLLIYNNMIGEQPSKIERMDLNGRDRRELCSFSGNLQILDGAAVGNGKVILCAVEIDPGGENINSCYCLLSVDIHTGEQNILYRVKKEEGEAERSLFLRGVSGTGFILKTIAVREFENDSDPVINKQNMENATVQRIFELSFDGTQEKELLSFSGQSCYEEHNGEELVYLRFHNDTADLCKIDSETGQEKILVEDIRSMDIFRKTDQPLEIYIAGFVDEYVLLDHLYQERLDAQGNIELLYTQYAVHTKTGEAREITLSQYSRATRKPINIITQAGEMLLVDAAEDVVNGMPCRIPGLIRVEDYLASNDRIQKIDLCLSLY